MKIATNILDLIRPPVSPLPDSKPKKILNFVKDQVRKMPESMWRSSPPGDLYNRLEVGKPYLSKGKLVPYDVQLKNNIETAKHGLRGAAGAITIGTAMRPFSFRPMGNSETLRRVGNNWERIFRN